MDNGRHEMATYKVRLKVGVHEFEGEGERQDIDALFSQWRELIDKVGNSAVEAKGGSAGTEMRRETGAEEVSSLQLEQIFLADEKRDLVMLRSLPTGEARYADAVLLVLYGFRRFREQDEVLVTVLKSSLEASGSSPARIDRITEPLIREGLLLKGGKAKGGKYRLTTKGVARAEELTQQILGQLA